MSPIIINGSIDIGSAKYIYGYKTMSVIHLSFKGNNFEISSGWYNSHTYSVDELLNKLNSGVNVKITYLPLKKSPFSQKTINEIIGLQVEDTDYLIAEKGLNKLMETYKLSKNLTLIASIILILIMVIWAWAIL